MGVLSPPQNYLAIYLLGTFGFLSNSGCVINLCLGSKRILPLASNTILSNEKLRSQVSSPSPRPNSSHTQITIYNNKSIAIRNLNVIDVVPLSRD